MKIFRNIPFRRQLTAAILLSTLLITSLIGLTSYRLAYRQLRETSIQMTEDSFKALHLSVNDYLDNVKDCTTELLTNDTLRSVVESDGNVSSVEQFLMETELLTGISQAIRQDIAFSQVEIYLRNGISFSFYQDSRYDSYSECLTTLDAISAENQDHYIGIQWLILPPGSHTTKPEMTCVRYLYSARMERLGVALFSLQPLRMDQLFGALDGAMIVTHSGQILSAKDNNLIGTKMDSPTLLALMAETPRGDTITYREDSSERLASYAWVGNSYTYLVMPNTAYETMLETQTREYRTSILALILIGVLFSAMIALILSRSLSKGIQKLMDFIKQVGTNHDTNLRYPIEGNSEYDDLGSKLNSMLDAIQNRTAQREEALQANQALELSLLRAQLNPHLLYNTLNSVLWNLENHRDEHAITLLASLSGYFQHTLSRGQAMIPLADELQLIEHYLVIQRVARHKDFTLDLQVPTDLLSVPLPKLTLQPIVENAVLHGLDGYRDDGIITISAQKNGNLLQLLVEDNGFGIFPEKLEELNESLRYPPIASQLESYGLYGINRILRETYGSDAFIHITSEIDRYTRVTVTIPIAEPEEGGPYV